METKQVATKPTEKHINPTLLKDLPADNTRTKEETERRQEFLLDKLEQMKKIGEEHKAKLEEYRKARLSKVCINLVSTRKISGFVQRHTTTLAPNASQFFRNRWLQGFETIYELK